MAHGSVPAHVETVVVGSGFGGSVTAFRLAEAGREVLVLERGRRYPPGSFSRTPRDVSRSFWDPSEGMHGLFDVWSFRGLEAVVASGVGGGSLIYANVLLRMDERWFVRDGVGNDRGTGVSPWPVGRADLEWHYDEVEQMLGVARYPLGVPGYEVSGKSAALRDAADRLGLQWQLPPLAVSFSANGQTAPGLPLADAPYGNIHGQPRTTCQLTGECDVGCNYGSKNTLDHTYLSAAVARGARILDRCEVRSFAPTRDGGWTVRYVDHSERHPGEPGGTGSADGERRPADTARPALRTMTCRRLVLAAGTLGTTYLLLRNARALPALSPRLGHNFSGNGDLLGFVLDASDAQGGTRPLGSSTAPVITSAVRIPDALDGGSGPGYYIEDAGYPGFVDWLLEAADTPGLVNRTLGFTYDRLISHLLGPKNSSIGAQVARLIGDGSRAAGATPLLGMGRDVPDGVMRLRDRWLDVDWTVQTSRHYFARVKATMADLAAEMGGRFEPNPLSMLHRVITVHPLGGSSMGTSPADGVVDGFGQVFGHPGLYVVDGAAMPAPVGANPSLTIAAFADRAALQMLDGLSPPAARRAATAAKARATAKATAKAEQVPTEPRSGGDVPGKRAVPSPDGLRGEPEDTR